LTGGKLEQGDKTRTILSGWVNTVDGARNEARGSFSIVAVDVISLSRGPIIITSHGIELEMLALQPSPAQIPGTYRWRFVARCDAESVMPLVRPNPSLTATQEVLVGRIDPPPNTDQR
jgi:hypothetical protein